MTTKQAASQEKEVCMQTMLDPTPDAPSRRQIFFQDQQPPDRFLDRDDERTPNRPRGRPLSRRDSINSIRSRSNQNSGIPIGFRTLSFNVSESRSQYDKDASAAGEKRKDKKHTSKDFAQADQHMVSADELCNRYRVSPNVGLSSEAASKRLQQDGKNILPRQKTNYWKKLLGYVFGGFCSILWVGVIIFFICWRPLGDPDPAPYNLGLAVLVIIVILLQASFSAFQDWSTHKTMNSILDMLPSDAFALRDGNYTKIQTSDLVVGDIVRISIGNKVPADLRLIKNSDDVRFDRSALTGESEEIEGASAATDDNFLETRNIALLGTMVTNGSAIGLVIYTGPNTVMGAIATATSEIKEGPTAIQREITRFVRIICCLTAFLATLILFTWVGWLRVDHFAFMNVVAMLNDVMGCVVAFIPEGMPVGVALTLMMIARRMKAANVLPKSLATVETLGCVQVLCSDKTGTLTKNQMRVTTVGFVDHLMSASDATTVFNDNEESRPLKALHKAAHLCNEATFDPLSLDKPAEDRLTQGNATDGAILRFAEAARPGIEVRNTHAKLGEIAFNSKNKFMVTVHNYSQERCSEEPPHLMLVKGAPDVLLPKCTSYWSYQGGKILELDDIARADLMGCQTKMSRNAERVILLCQKELTPSNAVGSNGFAQELQGSAIQDLTVIGIVGIFDPPRPEAAVTVAACRRAGIRFFMMTGDFGLTGAAIARQTGIFSGERDPDNFDTILRRRRSATKQEISPEVFSNQSLLLEGDQINKLEEGDWDLTCAYEEVVFGRCTPEHKLRIVKELKHRGFSTAVTGDGVNDAPALKAADVGIAMVNGSDVSLEAADLVLLDQFSSIVDGIRLGRLVFQNLQKVIGYLLPAGSWSEIWPVLLNVFFGVPLPLSSFLMIIICVFTDLFCSLSLIMEKEEFDLLSLPPRDRKKEHLINLRIYGQSYLFMGVMETVIAHSMYFLYYWRHAKIPIGDLWFAFEKYSAGFHGYTQAELTHFNVTGQSVYFITLVILQWGNILSIRNKKLSILQADPFRKQRRNPWLLASVMVSLAIAIFVTQEPGIQSLFNTASAPLEFWFIPLPLALGILSMDELRKLAVRIWPHGFLARIAW
ncbi:hypothetical protein H2204_006502 [Knufia peltigerae]|uniref:Cation-transporting P-type ATPase N-terminal domain-containing protein n=1 Tax=Knufia peltigerae TaxID=1002370 RepID=A0AA38Y3U7_9EURO|nr:hypothetical protein H2204_006502 [Knufia peltigerae]